MRPLAAASLVAAGAAWLGAGCQDKSAFPDQIPAVVSTLGQFHSSWSARDRVRFDSVCVDRELYDALVNVIGEDSLAVLSRRIHNPIDSAAVEMTVARFSQETGQLGQRYDLELFMHREGDRFWIVGHRLRPSLP